MGQRAGWVLFHRYDEIQIILLPCAYTFTRENITTGNFRYTVLNACGTFLIYESESEAPLVDAIVKKILLTYIE